MSPLSVVSQLTAPGIPVVLATGASRNTTTVYYMSEPANGILSRELICDISAEQNRKEKGLSRENEWHLKPLGKFCKKYWLMGDLHPCHANWLHRQPGPWTLKLLVGFLCLNSSDKPTSNPSLLSLVLRSFSYLIALKDLTQGPVGPFSRVLASLEGFQSDDIFIVPYYSAFCISWLMNHPQLFCLFCSA